MPGPKIGGRAPAIPDLDALNRKLITMRNIQEETALSVRFFKKQRIAMWRIFNEVDETGLHEIFEEIGYFSRENSIITCILDFTAAKFSIANQEIGPIVTEEKVGKSFESIEYVHIIANAQQQASLSRWFARHSRGNSIITSEII